MTLRSEIITCFPTNTAILHLSEHLLSGSPSFSWCACYRPSLIPATDILKSSIWLFEVYFDFASTTHIYIYFCAQNHTLFFLSLFSPSLHLSPKDTSVSSVQPGCSLVLARQWAMQAFFPTVGFWVESLPSHAFSWACFTHTIDCRWCSGLSPADLEGKLDTSLSEEEPPETRQKQHTR